MLKSAEKEIFNGANKYNRTVGAGGPSHPFVNLWSLEDALQGLEQMATGNVPGGLMRMGRGVAIKGASKLSDHLLSPDRRIPAMFDLISKHAPSPSVIKNIEGSNLPSVGKLIEKEPQDITVRPNQYVRTGQKEWPTKEKYRDGIPINQ